MPLENKINPNSVKPPVGNTEPSRGITPEGVETRRVDIQCGVCATHKDVSEFYVKDRKTGRRDSKCKACRIIQTREFVLGVTEAQYRSMHRDQSGRCGICRTRMRSRRMKKFAVDHCHTTGRIRGLLCSNCNTGLGLFKDNLDTLHRAIDWIKV